MRPRFVINKGISKKITAVSSHFVADALYYAVIYNPKDTSLKIASYAYCAEENERKQIVFMFSSADTAKLREGFATIEIYDSNQALMVYRDNFAVIRKNSLQISGDMPTPSQSSSSE